MTLLSKYLHAFAEQSHSDYPDAVSNNAKRGIELNKKVNNKCATQVGKIRAQQLADKSPLSVDTISRMYSYLSRAEGDYDESDTTACGTISFLLWGGLAGKRWSESKLKELGKIKLADQTITCTNCGHQWKLSDGGSDPYICHNCGHDNQVKLAEGIPHYLKDGTLYKGPTHKHNGRLMTGATHSDDSEYLYHKDELAEVGPRGGIKESKKAPKSKTPNKNPKGEGTAKGDASTSRGAEVPKAVEETLQKKADEFNEKHKEKLGYGVTIGQLKTVYQRGVGAYNTSHSPKVTSQQQWAYARVNAYLYLVKNGRPQNPKYTTDYDLLPSKHPKSGKA